MQNTVRRLFVVFLFFSIQFNWILWVKSISEVRNRKQQQNKIKSAFLLVWLLLKDLFLIPNIGRNTGTQPIFCLSARNSVTANLIWFGFGAWEGSASQSKYKQYRYKEITKHRIKGKNWFCEFLETTLTRWFTTAIKIPPTHFFGTNWI